MKSEEGGGRVSAGLPETVGVVSGQKKEKVNGIRHGGDQLVLGRWRA